MEFIHDGYIVRPIEDNGGHILDSNMGLGIPRSNNCHLAAYKAVALWLLEQKVESICGQVLSGAQMAFGVAMAAEGKIHPVFIPKDNYYPRKHYNEVECRSPYAIIDDIVSSGYAMCEVIDETKRLAGTDPMFVIVHQIFSVPEMLEDKIGRDRIFTVSKLMED